MLGRSLTQYIKSNFNDALTAVDGFVSDNINATGHRRLEKMAWNVYSTT